MLDWQSLHGYRENADGDQFYKANPNEIMPGPKEMPSPLDRDYEYNASRIPPVLSTVFNATSTAARRRASNANWTFSVYYTNVKAAITVASIKS